MSPQTFDTIIRGGRLIDGTGAPARKADLAISDGRIAAIGTIEGEAARVIDATGSVVAPGFIDVHSHDDVALINTPGLDFKAAQGVTTVVCGNCGAGAAPATERLEAFYARGVEGILGPVESFTWRSLGEFYDTVRAAKPSVNAAFLIPHGATRVAVMGWERRAPTDAELDEMKEHVAEGMRAGAVGLSTGLIYAPGAYAETGEIIALARVAAEHGGIYVSHIRNEGAGLLEAVGEAIQIGDEAGLPVQISHHKASGEANYGLTKQSIPLIEKARERGAEVTFDAYPYTAASTALAALFRGGRFREGMGAEDIVVASVKHQHQYEGKRLSEIASMMDLPLNEATSRLLREEDNAVAAVMFVMDEGDVRRVLQHPLCMIGSDGLPSPTGKPHPRLYGTFPRVLGRYVRDEGLMSLEEGVRRMTSLPASVFRLGDRGELRVGAWADAVVFDPERVEDVATYEDPRRHPAGISHVLVNGQVVVDAGTPSSPAAGQVIARA
ncbi:MAG: D-aminoacylase [Chloroflexi bacterium]|nr:D-aminoacylase [Chloroflexota bacterium]